MPAATAGIYDDNGCDYSTMHSPITACLETLMDMHVRHVRNPEIVTATVADGLVMMDIARGSYYSLDSLGCRVWDLLETPSSLDEICLLLIAEYEVDQPTCIAQIGTLLQELLDEKMISPAASGVATR